MARSYPLRRRLTRFSQIDNRRRLLLAEAVGCLLVARLALLFVPFPRLARKLGAFVPPDDPRALRARERAAADQIRTAEEVGWAVTRAARHVPIKAVCLPQAMAARVMLKRARGGERDAFRRGQRRGEAARRARVARRRRRRSHRLSGGAEFLRDRLLRLAFA